MSNPFASAVRSLRPVLRRIGLVRPRFRGGFDAVRWGQAVGWVQDIDRPNVPVAVEIRLDGIAVGRGLADRHRGDLEAAGRGNGRHAFAIPLAAEPPGNIDQARLSAHAARGRREITRSPAFAVEAGGEAGRFEAISGWTAVGWAASRHGPGPVEVEFLIGGEVVATTVARSFRADVGTAGYGGGEAGFFVELPVRPRPGETIEVEARFKGSGAALPGSPQPYRVPAYVDKWLGRAGRATPATVARLRRRSHSAAAGRSLSIIIPSLDGIEPARAATAAVCASWCDAWEVVVVTNPAAERSGSGLVAPGTPDPRIQVVACFGSEEGAAIAAGIGASQGDFVLVLDPEDRLEPDAVGHLLAAGRDEVDIICADEVATGRDPSDVRALVAYPAFSWDTFVSRPVPGGVLAARRTLALSAARPEALRPGSARLDLALLAIERARSVAHVPAPLIRRADPRAAADPVAAIQRHLGRIGLPALAVPGLSPETVKVEFPDAGGRVAIVIPTRNKAALLAAAIRAIEATTTAEQVEVIVVDHESDEPDAIALLGDIARRHRVVPYRGAFNFSAMNNLAVREAGAGCRHLLFMNNDVEAIAPGWLSRLRSLADRRDVGAVGATLAYPDGRVQHAGVILGLRSHADHAHRFVPLERDGVREPGHAGQLVSTREVSAVTAACLMMRRSVFEGVGGFDEALAVGMNDVDLCLRVGAAGLKVLADGHTVLIHRESATRAGTDELRHPADTARFVARWGDALARGDPFYNPLLTRTGADGTLSDRPSRDCRPRVRSVVLPQL